MAEWKTLEYPHLTEKSVTLIERANTVVFIVNLKAKKPDIKKEFEEVFEVKVAKVNTEITPEGKKKAYIKLIREDGKIDISLQPKKASHVISMTDKILEHLTAVSGKSALNDKSSPEDIKNEFHVSKKVFKQAIGKLYKQRKIKITDTGIELVTKP